MQYILNQEEYDEYMALKNQGKQESVEAKIERELFDDLMACKEFEEHVLPSMPMKRVAVFSIDADRCSDTMKAIVRMKLHKLGYGS